MNSQSKFSVSSTEYIKNQDIFLLNGLKAQRLESIDERYEFDAIPAATDSGKTNFRGGNFGVIYSGIDRGADGLQNVPIAMKINRVNDSTTDENTIKEAMGLIQIVDRCVMKVLRLVFINNGDSEIIGTIYEWIDGRQLNQINPKERLLYLEAYTQLAETLDRVHSQGHVHNDVRPENILISNDEQGLRCVLADWGISNLVTNKRKNRFQPYASPNALLNDTEFLPEDDNYSFAMCLYKTFAGYTAFYKYDSHVENRDEGHYMSFSENTELIAIFGKDITVRLDDYFKSILCSKVNNLHSARQIIYDLSQIIPLDKLK
jgi:serine/threonine protein kinase